MDDSVVEAIQKFRIHRGRLLEIVSLLLIFKILILEERVLISTFTWRTCGSPSCQFDDNGNLMCVHGGVDDAW